MAKANFTKHQLDKFNDHVQNCLEDPNCRVVFEDYLKRIGNHQGIKALKLWIQADSGGDFGEEMYDLIDDIDGFNENPLLSLAETVQKFAYVKSETVRLLGKPQIHRRFITYLRYHHKD